MAVAENNDNYVSIIEIFSRFHPKLNSVVLKTTDIANFARAVDL